MAAIGGARGSARYPPGTGGASLIEQQAHVEVDCEYRGECPLVELSGAITVRVSVDGARITPRSVGQEGLPDGLWIPSAAVRSIFYDEERLGLERAEIEEEVLIGDGEWLIRHTVVMRFVDPEGVMPSGFVVRFKFANEYGARVFANRASELLGLPPF